MKIVPNKKVKASIWQHFGFVKKNRLVDKTRVACKLCPDRMILKCSRNTLCAKKTQHISAVYILRMLRCHSLYKANYSFRPAGSFNIILLPDYHTIQAVQSNFWCNSAIYHQRSTPIQCCKKFRISEPNSHS